MKLLKITFCLSIFLLSFANAQKTDTIIIKEHANKHYNAVGIKSSAGISFRHHFGHIVLENNLSSIGFSGFYGFSIKTQTLILFQYNSKNWFQPYVGGGMHTNLYSTERRSFKSNSSNFLIFAPVLALGFEIIPSKPNFSFCIDLTYRFENKYDFDKLNFNLGIRYRFTKNK